MYTGFSDATVNPPGLARVAAASVLKGTLPSEPSTSRKTWRAPLTQFLRAIVLQLAIRAPAAVPNGSSGVAAVMRAFRFWVALPAVPVKPNPRLAVPKLSRTPLPLTSSGELAAGDSSTPSGVPAALEELITSSRPESPVFVLAAFGGTTFGFGSMPRPSEQ